MKEMVDTRRVKTLKEGNEQSGPVVYVMAREQRVEDNWALLYAQQQAIKANVPLLVLFVVGPMFNSGSRRHNDWMIASLQEVEVSLQKLQIPFFVECGEWSHTVASFVKQHAVQEVVIDFNPLEPVRSWREEMVHAVSCAVSMVDARNIVPCWIASPKAEFAAYTLRPKIHKLLPEFLTQIPKVVMPTVKFAGTVPTIDWGEVERFRTVSNEITIPKYFTPGAIAAKKVLNRFISSRLDGYAVKRNDPTLEAVSDLSPYLRWGNISAQRVALEVKAAEVPKADKDAYLEELIVRRELSDNYVYYTKDYATVAGAHAWAQTTLHAHEKDTREYVYTYEEFENAATHDELWNAMQRQMVTTGKMHGWCRMYWAKKILEWTKSPQEAIDVALSLNDRFELDGRDSNGVVGVMWSIAGVHDRAWTERQVFGKIRYMNFNGAKRKFDVASYIQMYGKETSLFNE